MKCPTCGKYDILPGNEECGECIQKTHRNFNEPYTWLIGMMLGALVWLVFVAPWIIERTQ